jgi:hypothetical protein
VGHFAGCDLPKDREFDCETSDQGPIESLFTCTYGVATITGGATLKLVVAEIGVEIGSGRNLQVLAGSYASGFLLAECLIG